MSITSHYGIYGIYSYLHTFAMSMAKIRVCWWIFQIQEWSSCEAARDCEGGINFDYVAYLLYKLFPIQYPSQFLPYSIVTLAPLGHP